MNWSPRVTVAAVVERQGRFLMVEETSNGRLVLNQPAGHLEDNETLIEAMCRETLEESAWHVRPLAVVGLYLWRHPRKQVTVLRIAFAAEATEHDPDRVLDTGIERALWLSRDDLLAEKPRLRSPLVMRTLDDYLGGDLHPLSLVESKGLESLLDQAKAV